MPLSVFLNLVCFVDVTVATLFSVDQQVCDKSLSSAIYFFKCSVISTSMSPLVPSAIIFFLLTVSVSSFPQYPAACRGVSAHYLSVECLILFGFLGASLSFTVLFVLYTQIIPYIFSKSTFPQLFTL